ncbi:hypothetical protein B0H34DRAFT_731505 [Crassisporium funariophilum]|nr:hypothetical protein B0H34DRAFT_731505 [Crassisporium funariophilum]
MLPRLMHGQGWFTSDSEQLQPPTVRACLLHHFITTCQIWLENITYQIKNMNLAQQAT